MSQEINRLNDIIMEKIQSEALISIAKSYIKAIDGLKEECPNEVAHILEILDCVHPDPGYHFGIYIEEAPKDFINGCDQAWFHCYLGNEVPIKRHLHTDTDGLRFNYHDDCYLRFTFDVFNYLTVKHSEMGAWQAYLICISKTLLPFSGSLFYTKRKLIFEREQFQALFPPYKSLKAKLMSIEKDLSPHVFLEGNKATVSCCYWNPWGGLIRETGSFTFFGEKVYILKDFKDEYLLKYDCGFRF